MKESSHRVSSLLEKVLFLLPILIIVGFVIFGFVRHVQAALIDNFNKRPAQFYLQSPLPTPTFTPTPGADTPTPVPATDTPTPVPATDTPTPVPATDTPIPPTNTAPEIITWQPLTDPMIEVNESVIFEGEFFDPDVNDLFTAVVDWGDGRTDTNEPFPIVAFTYTHQYNSVGIFSVSLTILDNAGGSDSETYDYVVVTDPNSGAFLTGAGRIDSPEGAYYPDPTLTGSANFGFNAHNNKNGETKCNVQFNLLEADMHYRSQVCAWLVISGDSAYLYGQGTINNLGNYTFYLTAVDGSSALTSGNDRLRLKIWDDAGVIYDNILPGTGLEQYQPLSQGEIKIHR